MPWVYIVQCLLTLIKIGLFFFSATASVAYIFLHLGGTITSSFRLQKKMSKMIWPHKIILIYTSLCRAVLKLFPGAYCQLKCIPLSIYLSIYLLFQSAHSHSKHNLCGHNRHGEDTWLWTRLMMKCYFAVACGPEIFFLALGTLYSNARILKSFEIIGPWENLYVCFTYLTILLM